jgi:large subunit ribosomal protein L19
MKNKFVALVEGQQIESIVKYKVKEKDKQGNEVEKELTRHLDDFQIGDTVDVHLRILEGQKERIQVYNGVVIARRGEGMREMFTVRRIVQGEGVERQFPVHSPKIAKIEVKRTGVVRRAKLYYLRDRVGKATRLRERKAKAPRTETPSS